MSTGTLYANPSTMEWDADANRVSFTSSTGGTTEFVYDTTAGFPAVIEEVTVFDKLNGDHLGGFR